MLRIGEPFWSHQNAENLLVDRVPTRTPLGELTALPRPSAPSPRSPLTILSLCLSCVYVHTCMKLHCYFPLFSLPLGLTVVFEGGLQLSSAGTAFHLTHLFDRQSIASLKIPLTFSFNDVHLLMFECKTST